MKFYSTTNKLITHGSGSACLVKAFPDYLENGHSTSAVPSDTSNNDDKECNARSTTAGRGHGTAGSNPPICPEMSQSCDCQKLKLNIGKIQDEIPKMTKNDISSL